MGYDEESDDLETDDEWDDDDGDNTKTTEDIPLSKPISFDYLFETSSNNFIKNIKTNSINIDMELFQYKGSLTIPPYTEGVELLISKTTHFINNKQLNKLRSCWRNE